MFKRKNSFLILFLISVVVFSLIPMAVASDLDSVEKSNRVTSLNFDEDLFGIMFMVRNSKGPMNNATIDIYKTGLEIDIPVQRLSTDFSGRAKFKLENNTNYRYVITSPGYAVIQEKFTTGIDDDDNLIQIKMTESDVPIPEEHNKRTFVFYVKDYTDESNEPTWYTGVGNNASMALMNALSINYVNFDFDYNADTKEISFNMIDGIYESGKNKWHPYVYNDSSNDWDYLKNIDDSNPDRKDRIYSLTYSSSSSSSNKKPDGEIQDPYWFLLQWDDRASWIYGISYDPTSAFAFACEDAKYPMLQNITNGDFRGWIGHIKHRGITLAPDKETWIYWVTYNIDRRGNWEFSNYVSGNLPEVHHFAYMFGHSFGNNTRTTPDVPLKPGYSFKGYFEDAEFTKPYDISKLPENPGDEINLYVKWEEGEEPGTEAPEPEGPGIVPPDTKKVVLMDVPERNVSIGEKVTIPVNVFFAENLSKFGVFISADPELVELKLNRTTPEFIRINGAFHNGNYNFTTKQVRYSFMSKREPVSGNGTILYIDAFAKKPGVSIPFNIIIEEMIENEEDAYYKKEVSCDLKVNPVSEALPPLTFVINGDGKLVDNANVTIYRPGIPKNIQVGSKFTKDGKATFDLPKGSYTYVVSAEGFYDYYISFDLGDEPLVMPVDLTSRRFMSDSSEVIFEVKGTYDNKNEALKNANVTLYNLCCPKNTVIDSVMTDSAGKASYIVKKYTPYIYAISAPGFGEVNGTIVPTKDNYPVSIQMGSYISKTSNVEFDVVSDFGPVKDAYISIYKSTEDGLEFLEELKTDPSGHANTELELGYNYICFVEAEGFYRSKESFTPSHESVNIKIKMVREVSSGKVYSVSVNYNTNKPSVVLDIEEGSSLPDLHASKKGYALSYWTDSKGNKIEHDYIVKGDLHLNANWKKLPKLNPDPNADKAGIVDVILLLQYYSKVGMYNSKTEDEMISLGTDLNDDGIIDLTDVILFLKSI